MRVACIGGGPAGLFFAILLKRARPDAQVTVYERNRPGDTFGWGVVFSDQTLGNIAAAEPATHRAIEDAFVHWDAIDVNFRGRRLRAGGQGFAGLGRVRLLEILQARAREVGVELHFESEVADEAAAGDADALVFADGSGSALRRRYAAEFGTTIDLRACRYVWLGTRHRFEAFTFAFEETQWGWFALHAYRFDRDTSTVIVECRDEAWLAAGLNEADAEKTIAFCEALFGKYLDGQGLMSNARHLANPWLRFPHIANERWSYGKRVLLGDAAHTAHFSIGSGTKLALEDAIAQAQVFVADALAARQKAIGELFRFQVRVAGHVLEPFEAVARGVLQAQDLDAPLGFVRREGFGRRGAAGQRGRERDRIL